MSKDDIAGDCEKLENLELTDDTDATYRPPPQKSLNELLDADKDDESLKKYKEKLLGEATAGTVIVGVFSLYFYACL